MAGGLDSIFLKASGAEKRGDVDTARQLLQGVLARFPANKRALQAVERLDRERNATAHAPYETLSALHDAYKRGDHAGAVARGDALAARHPDDPRVHALLGGALVAAGDPARATIVLRTAIALAPGDRSCFSNLGIALRRQGRIGEAEEAYKAALACDPDYADAHYNLGNLFGAQRRSAEAIAAYEAALRIRPDHVLAWYNLGNLHRNARDHRAAIRCYLALLEIEPGHADALNNLGCSMLEREHGEEAAKACRLAVRAAPGNAKAWINLGNAAELIGALDEARDAFAQAAAIDPGDADARAHVLFQEAYMCVWANRAAFADLPVVTTGAPIEPFMALPFADDPVRLLERTRAYARTSFERRMPAFVAPPREAGGRIRVGYFSADFHDHATVYLLAGLLREHDRARFEIRAYSYGGGERSAMRGAVRDHVDAFVDLRDLDDAAAVALVRDDALDIAIDLKGYTKNARAQLFVERVAPVQIGYLGYPGSVGADFLDYMIADAVVVPEGDEALYDERILRLPGSYQANDDRRAIATDTRDRASFGLPAEAFVFCCFNHPYKIGPREFDIWMRLLHAVPGSVLWLLRPNRWAEENLRAEAAARGVAAARLVFTDPLPHAEHLARHRHADLFLDTFAVNAHTTASDALWGGLPVLTLAGRQFAARVGASLLTAIGLPELITRDEADYEALALALARDPARLAALRARLAANRRTTALFDTVAQARAIEAVYAGVVATGR